MVFVDISAHPVASLSVRVGNTNAVAVLNAELFFVFRCNETDTFLGITDMVVKPFLFVAVAVKVIFIGMRFPSSN